jgi:signal transduction histidine kinase
MRLSGCLRAADSGSLITACREALQKQNDILAQVKTICNNLVPPDFRQLGLVGALRVLCGEFSGKNAIECRVSVQENLDIETLGIENQLQCYRLVQESLSNIAKHSGATEAVVVVRKAASPKPSLLICVSDDGKGFAKPPSQYDGAAGMGIRGMYERIAILGGELSFLTMPGEGAMVRIEIPLPEPGNQEL